MNFNVVENRFLDNIGRFKGREYLLFMILYSIAPTLLDSKPSVLMNFSKNNNNLLNLWSSNGGLLEGLRGIQYYELKRTENNSTVLFYKKEALQNILNCKDINEYLCMAGYEGCKTIEEYLKLLKYKFQKECPHEIGLFLGIPLSDVKCFIQFKGDKFKLCGYWKVYDDMEGALNTFRNYDLAKDKIMDMICEKKDIFSVINTMRVN